MKKPLSNVLRSMLRVLLVVVIITFLAFDGMLPLDDGSILQSVLLGGFVKENRELGSSLLREGDGIEANNSFCVPWTQNSDNWWTHNVQWEMDVERDNETHYCFKRIRNEEKLRALNELYQVQFLHGDCSQTVTKKMWSSGWNADMLNIMDGLKHAVLHHKPFQISNQPWHYANPRLAKPAIQAYKDIEPVCPEGTMFCYFLPLSNCSAAPVVSPRDMLEEQFVGSPRYQWYYEYVTRRQTWLRKAVYDFSKKQQTMTTPCTVIHIRRGDVVLHPGEYKRRYHPVRDYLRPQFQVQHNIFLLTDDANAIAEAKTEFPNYNWMYVDRPRFQAAEGGFENQMPSKDPIHEVVVILTVFQMARKCQSLVHSHSTFASQVLAEMEASAGAPIRRIQIDIGPDVFSGVHGNTLHISKDYNNSTSNEGSSPFSKKYRTPKEQDNSQFSSTNSATKRERNYQLSKNIAAKEGRSLPQSFEPIINKIYNKYNNKKLGRNDIPGTRHILNI
ncbi:Alpha-(1,6)-fucosyltransferase [Seminavis robusta]|uniref:Alpha-(1,6)-fucosyltransferase n=1 Tax=Seminavis robusta TaxID=568900 RepID=A0A9N8DXU9_9STRA|nr:Alpha-(1,6)-fucosyltransferase [Seminavis robusta]|eukprot:Sro459_g147300.1 Alpha-(1,6)-fucosyltransferase (502) ;mRNA; f:34560-36065